jgi:hypothetical protein
MHGGADGSNAPKGERTPTTSTAATPKSFRRLAGGCAMPLDCFVVLGEAAESLDRYMRFVTVQVEYQQSIGGLPPLPEIGYEGWTIDMRRRKPTNLFIDDAPIGVKRPPIEIVQTDAAPIFRHEAHADDAAIRLPDK